MIKNFNSIYFTYKLIGLFLFLQIISCSSDNDVSVPSITGELQEVTRHTATIDGKITTKNKDDIITYGVCWDTESTPSTTSNNKTIKNISSGSFTCKLEGLLGGTTYYARIYTISSTGTFYGKEITIQTLGTRTGEKIAFDYYGNLYTVNIDGTNIQQLTNDEYYKSKNYDPSWFPNGGRIAYVKRTIGSDDGNIYIMNSDGTNNIRITNEKRLQIRDIAVSPNGHKILYVLGENVFCINSDGTNNTQLTDTISTNHFEPNWFPDGQRILYSQYSDPDYMISLRIYNLAESTEYKISNDILFNNPSVLFNGQKIIYQTFEENSKLKSPLICTINPDGSERKEILKLQNPTFNYLIARWSPDGQKIIYTTGSEIYMVSHDGTGQTLILGMSNPDLIISKISIY